MFHKTPKMLAENHFPDIIEINLEYALNTYDWQNWHPISGNGITVTGFWNKSEGQPDPDIFQLDERGVYIRR